MSKFYFVDTKSDRHVGGSSWGRCPGAAVARESGRVIVSKSQASQKGQERAQANRPQEVNCEQA